MTDPARASEELLAEIAALRQKNKELEKSESARKEAERRQHLAVEILAILNDPPVLADTIKSILFLIKRETGFDAVGIRLRSGDDFPYFVQNGFSQDFLLTENTLIARDENGSPCRDKNGVISLECTCGLILSGQTDPSNPLFTDGGSVWTNNSLPLLDLPAAQDPRLHPRNNCIHQGYLSVALIPIRAKREIVGLLQFNDRRKDCLNLELIHFFEGIAASIGVALMRRQAEEELERQRTLFRQVIDTSPNLVFVKDGEFRYILVNRALAKAYGVTMEHMIGKTDGELGATPAEASKYRKEDEEVLHTGKTLLIAEEKFTLPSGEVRFYQTTKLPLTGNGPTDTSILGISMDITTRKQIEEELLRVKKLESLGILAGGIAHDFNNMMVAVQGYIDLSLLQLTSDHKTYKYLSTARQCMAQAGELTSRLITFSKGDFPFRKTCDVANLIRGAVRRMVMEANINLSFDFRDDLWPAEIDELQIRQVFYNLTANALEAMPAGGTIAIRGTNVEIHGDDALPLKEGPYLQINFADEGIGIPAEHLAKVFDPYFSTKETWSQRGMGLGLSVCYSVLKKHEGYITIDSQPGKGTEVTLYLPALAAMDK